MRRLLRRAVLALALIGGSLTVGTLVETDSAGAQAPTNVSIAVPSNGATVSGSSQVLDALATGATSVSFTLFGGEFNSSNNPTLCTATATIYGWICGWDTTTIPNGTYFLVADASNASGVTTAGSLLTVNNPNSFYVNPAAIPDTCTTDQTAALNSFLASIPANATVNFPVNACYIVSNNADQWGTNSLAFGPANGPALSGVTYNGHGTTFHQTEYEGNVCGNNAVQPVMYAAYLTNATFNNFTLEGNSAVNGCSGSTNEGDAGVYTYPGYLTNVTFNGVLVEDVSGDGFDNYPHLGVGGGLNQNVTIENSAFVNIGYHVFVPEGVYGWTIKDNLFSGDSNFMDLEVDSNNCESTTSCTDAGIPNTCADLNSPSGGLVAWGIAQCDITIDNNTFVNNSSLDIESESNGVCWPQDNFSIEGNTMDASSSMFIIDLGSELGPVSQNGSGTVGCPRPTNMTIENNTVAMGTPSNPNIGVKGQGDSAEIQVENWDGVTIANNHFNVFDGTPGAGANWVHVDCIALVGDNNVTIDGNTCANGLYVWDSADWAFDTYGYTNTNIFQCGNTYGLTNPMTDTSVSPPSTPPAAPKLDASC